MTKKLAGGTDASASMQAAWTYDAEGRPRNVQYPLSGPTYQYSYDSRGMPSRLQNLAGPDVVASVVYGPAGEMTSMTMGSGGGSESRASNVNGQLTTLTWPLSGRTVTYTFPGPGTNNGKGSSITDSGETVNYAYDSLNRLTSASVVSGWSQTFSYDGFGNLTGEVGSNLTNPTNAVNPANNRLNGVTYDANGNQETMPMTAGMTDGFTVGRQRADSDRDFGCDHCSSQLVYDPADRPVAGRGDTLRPRRGEWRSDSFMLGN